HPDEAAVTAWIEEVRNTPRIQRESEGSGKQGGDTGAVASHPATGEEIPIWLADYVLPDYGSGAIMAVPARGQRDPDFARQSDLPVRRVYEPDASAAPLEQAETTGGRIRGIEGFEGLEPGPEAVQRFIAWVEQQGWGRAQVRYRLRDWLISRQRYW